MKEKGFYMGYYSLTFDANSQIQEQTLQQVKELGFTMQEPAPDYLLRAIDELNIHQSFPEHPWCETFTKTWNAMQRGEWEEASSEIRTSAWFRRLEQEDQEQKNPAQKIADAFERYHRELIEGKIPAAPFTEAQQAVEAPSSSDIEPTNPNINIKKTHDTHSHADLVYHIKECEKTSYLYQRSDESYYVRGSWLPPESETDQLMKCKNRQPLHAVYKCSNDVPTVGYGITDLKSLNVQYIDHINDKNKNLCTITDQQAEDSLRNKLPKYEQMAKNFVKELCESDKVTNAQKELLQSPRLHTTFTSMFFQLGPNWPPKFPSAVKHMKNGEFKEAAAELGYGANSKITSKWEYETPLRAIAAKYAVYEVGRETAQERNPYENPTAEEIEATNARRYEYWKTYDKGRETPKPAPDSVRDPSIKELFKNEDYTLPRTKPLPDNLFSYGTTEPNTNAGLTV